jgi:phosphatidylglycerol---prolipoprotein diacylglyceryl transferase
MFPRILQIGDFSLPTYGVMVALAFLAGMKAMMTLAKRRGLPEEPLSNLAVYSALAGLAGAKLFMFLFDWQLYAAHPSEIFSMATLRAAGVYQGGFLLAIAFGVWYLRQQRLPVLTVLDCAAPGVAIGHAIGRLGCFAAGCCWGIVCQRPWAVVYRDALAGEMSGVPLGIPLHPAQLYEAIGNLLLFLLSWRLADKLRNGRLFAFYLASYSVLRFGVESGDIGGGSDTLCPRR